METVFLIIALVITAATIVPGVAVSAATRRWSEVGRISFLGALLLASIVVLYLN